MNPRLFGSTLTFAILLTLSPSPFLPTQAQSQLPAYQYSRLSFQPYHPLRTGYDSLPVQISGMGGGKLGSKEKFKLYVSSLKNGTSKNITAVRFTCFIFNFKDPNELVGRESTALIPLDLPAAAVRKVDILILNVDEVPLLAYKPEAEFRLELAVTEVRYDDGTLWEPNDLPGRLIPPEER